MNTDESFSNSIYDDEADNAERELPAFLVAVTALCGKEQARLSRKDRLDESELMDSPPRSEVRNWHAVTVAASARLANRLNVPPHDRSLIPSTDTKVVDREGKDYIFTGYPTRQLLPRKCFSNTEHS